jgi:hypothetical protein
MKKYILLLLCVLLFSGCGARGGSAPPGSSITIGSFDGVTDTNTAKQLNSETVQVVVTDSKGNGVNNAKIDISFNYTTSPDKTIAGDITSIVTLCGGTQIVNSTVEAKTDDWGVYYLCLEYQSGGGLVYAGNVKVASGDQSVSTGLAVQ